MYSLNNHIQTHIQAKNTIFHNSNDWIKVGKDIMANGGMPRMMRGVTTMLSACVPAHALYFTFLEKGKEVFGGNKQGHTPIAAAAAGVCVSYLNDIVV